MSRINLEKILVATADEVPVAAGTALVNSTPGTGFGQYNIKDGQLGFFDAKTRLAVDGTNVANSGKLIIVRGNGGGDTSAYSATVEYAAAGAFTACEIKEVSAEPYRAGTAETVDFLFKCTDCASDYTLKVGINNPDFNMFFPGNSQHFETFSVRSEDCPSCGDDCDYTHDCAETLTKLVTAINANDQIMQYMTSVAAIASDDAIFDTYTTYTCGIRFTTKLAERDCTGCFPPAEHSIHKFVKISLKLGTGFTSANTLIVEGSPAVLEEGGGDKLQWREFRSERKPGNASVQTTGHPYYSQRKDSRTKGLKAVCATNYCLLTLTQRMVDSGTTANEHPFVANMQTVIAVPTTNYAKTLLGNGTATAGALSILNVFFNSKPCGPTSVLTCASDSDAGDITAP